MITLKNVCKSYVSKRKCRVDALTDVSLDIADRGLVFVLGKSGSGKSTLLNLLGGLDGATGGEIIVDGKNFADFKKCDYDRYRNEYVGFVFQDFNLLNDFNVSGNVALALHLSRNTEINDKVSNALKTVGLSDSYLMRKIDELSGGEKQRVAIARAIIKESKIILADEPTGNLDSATGESIWNIFKELSRSKLVVVVSHDRDSAEKYADRIIEISDGRVIADTVKNDVCSPTLSDTVRQGLDDDAKAEDGISTDTVPSSKRKRLSNKVCLKMGVNNLFKRKVKSVCVILLSIFTVFALLVTEVVNAFSPEKSFAEFIENNNIDYISVSQGFLKNGNEFDPFEHVLKPSTERYIKRNARYIKNGIIKSKEDILAMGLTFVSEPLDINDRSVYLTMKGLDSLYQNYNAVVEINGYKEKLNARDHPPEILTGKYMQENGDRFLCAGIVATDKCNKLVYDVFPKKFVTEGCIYNKYNNVHMYYLNSDERFPEVRLKFGGVDYAHFFEIQAQPSYIGAKIITKDGLFRSGEVSLADDEIVLSYEMYSYMFKAKSEWEYISPGYIDLVSVPEHIGDTVPISIQTYEERETLIDLGSKKLAGVVFDCPRSGQSESLYGYMRFATGLDTYKNILLSIEYNSEFLIQVSSIKDISDFLVDFRDDHTGYVISIGSELVDYYYDEEVNYAGQIYGFEHDIYEVKFIFLAIAVLMAVIFTLLVINLISFSVANRRKEIGILSALGTTNRDLIKIFIIETLIISLITIVFNIVGIYISAYVFNNVISSYLSVSVPLMRVDIFTYMTLFGAAVILPVLATLIPLRKIFKMKPIDAIKEL